MLAEPRPLRQRTAAGMRDLMVPLPFAEGDRVRVRATGAEGVVVEVSRRHRTVDVDLGDGVTAELSWDEVERVSGGGDRQDGA